MVAQSTERTSSATQPASSYGTVGPPGMANGVTAEARHLQTRDVAESPGLENPNLLDPAPDREQRVDAPPVDQARQDPPLQMEPQFDEPHRSANVMTYEAGTTDAAMPASEQRGTPTTPMSSTVRVQEYYTAQSGSSTSNPQGVRWMARFSEFLRTAADRGASGVDRFLDGLGIPQLHHETTQTRRLGPLQQTSAAQATMVVYSPPEELPPPPRRPVQPPPRSWENPQQADPLPLFGPAQLERMRQAQVEYPHIYGQTSEGGSEHSSRLQAEVQRQLEEYNAKHMEEMRKMSLEVEKLRSERMQWEMRARSLLEPERRLSHEPGDPRQQLPGDPRQQLPGDPRHSFQVILVHSFQVILVHSFQVILVTASR